MTVIASEEPLDGELAKVCLQITRKRLHAIGKTAASFGLPRSSGSASLLGNMVCFAYGVMRHAIQDGARIADYLGDEDWVEFIVGETVSSLPREDTEQAAVADYECVEYRSVVKHRAFGEPLIKCHLSEAEAEEWLDAERTENASAIEYARVEWRMVTRWIAPPDRRFFTRRTEANTPRSEMEPNRRKLHDRRGVVRDTKQEHER
jgi:hypothetical protein